MTAARNLYEHFADHRSQFAELDAIGYVQRAIELTDPASTAFPGRLSWTRTVRGDAVDIFFDKPTRTVAFKYKNGPYAGKISTMHKLTSDIDLAQWALRNGAPAAIRAGL